MPPPILRETVKVPEKMVTVTRIVDLRSDTVTKPTEAMRAAMASAEVDDDVLGYDPTAFRLEAEMARTMGKEAALFVPSGTMGNLICVLAHCDTRGSEVILGDNCHIYIYENGGIATIGGVHPRAVKNNHDGTMDIDLIEAAIRDPKGELMYPTTKLICLENTHANTGGRCLSVEYTDRVGEVAKKHGLKLHIDGARIFNASVALGVPVDRLVKAADSVSVCLSKGIGAPVGSVIVGSKNFITKARCLRKTLGGGMRQIGILCAAALVALKENVGKLESDHKKARLLADGLNEIKGLRVDPCSVETNIIYIKIEEGSRTTAEEICKYLKERGILLMPESSTRLRIVLHHQISASDVQYTLSCFQVVASSLSWAVPPPGWTKCNVDAALWQNQATVGVGAVLRDDRGWFLKARTNSIHSSMSAVEAEAWGLLQALQWVTSEGYSNVIFEMDCKQVVDDIVTDKLNFSEYGCLLRECKSILQLNNSMQVVFVKRQANGGAHALAKASTCYAPRTILNSIPQCIWNVIINEMP